MMAVRMKADTRPARRGSNVGGLFAAGTETQKAHQQGINICAVNWRL